MNGKLFDAEGPKCARCGSLMVFRDGKFGGFYGCVEYPDCRFTVAVREWKGKTARLKGRPSAKCAPKASLLPPLPEPPYVPKHPSEVGLTAPACNPNWEVRGSDKLPWE